MQIRPHAEILLANNVLKASQAPWAPAPPTNTAMSMLTRFFRWLVLSCF